MPGERWASTFPALDVRKVQEPHDASAVGHDAAGHPIVTGVVTCDLNRLTSCAIKR